ncbi:lipopolysaccharide biosynthesis protein [Planctomycetes bacterium TBK1r]|uniref:Polysaccharide biosynthesis protein n=1 Tax=Stieleria magnilauensis TaxID=2527963 RepID=A0ABX5XRL0_9BACT|nr:hypothetical protein TBK1r_35800 [Planctomycetes bacterium TBK1r]
MKLQSESECSLWNPASWWYIADRFFSQHARLSRAWTLGKLCGITGSAQVTVQAIGFLSGLVTIQLLPPREYALYTLATTMLGTMTLLADGGVATGVMAQGGKVWQDRAQLGKVLVTGLKMRKQFAIWSLVFGVPVLLCLLRHHGASWLSSGFIVLCIVPALFTTLSAKLLEIAPKLTQDIGPLQGVQVSLNASRFAMVGPLLLLFPSAGIALLANGIAQLLANGRLRKLSDAYADLSEREDPVVRRDILGIVKRVLPGAIYSTFSAQLTIWLISIFGSTESLAEVAAISKVLMVLSLFTVIFSTLVAPRFARLQRNKHNLTMVFVKVQFSVVTLLICAGLLASCFSTQLTAILGSNYTGTAYVFQLQLVSSILSVIGGCGYSLLTARGIVPAPYLFIPMSLVFKVAPFLYFSPTSVVGVLLAAIVSTSLYLCMLHAFAITSLRKSG